MLTMTNDGLIKYYNKCNELKGLITIGKKSYAKITKSEETKLKNKLVVYCSVKKKKYYFEPIAMQEHRLCKSNSNSLKKL